MFFVNGSLVTLAHAARFIVMLNLEKSKPAKEHKK